MTDWARIERLARQAAARWRGHPDHDDLVQECRIAAWQHRDLPDRFIMRRCRFRCIDVLRVMHKDRRYTTTIVVPLGDNDGATVDELAVSASWGLAGRHALIAEGLASGKRPSDIAAELGVHPSRVSQLIGELRQLIV